MATLCPVHPLAPEHAAALSAISPQHLLSTFGVVGVFAILFIQMGLLVGFFLPGDSLLFIAGYATDKHNSIHVHLPLGWLLMAAALGAVVGGQLGYELGRRAGHELHTRESRYYKVEYVDRARRFLDRFGAARAVVLSRFVPVVRTFTSPIVGVAGMARPRYSTWNFLGGLVWTIPIVLLGHYLGHIDFLRKYIEILAIIIVVAAIIPALLHMWQTRRATH